MSGSISPDVQLRTARVALFGGSSPIMCIDPSRVEELSSDALVTAAGAAGGTGGSLLLTAVRIEARSGLGDNEVRLAMQAVCEALQGQMVEGSVQTVGVSVNPPPPSTSPSPQPPPPPPAPVRPSRSATNFAPSPPSPLSPLSASPSSRTSPPPSRSAAAVTEPYTVPPRSGAKIVGPKVMAYEINFLCLSAFEMSQNSRASIFACERDAHGRGHLTRDFGAPGLSSAGHREEKRL